MNYLVLGSNGMAGHMIALFLTKRGHNVTGFARQKGWLSQTILGDATDKQGLIKALESSNAEIVINCLGVLNAAVDQKLSDGIYINSVIPHLLAEHIGEKKLIHISTDCVFSGKRGRYVETDMPDAETMYGKSKALGEVIDKHNLTIRTSIVGPELKQNGIGLFHWFMHQEMAGGYSRVQWSGVTTLQLAKIIETVSRTDLTGLYHLVNNKTISKYDLLGLFNRYCRTKKADITMDNTMVCDKSLVDTRRNVLEQVPDYEDMIREMGDWLYLNKELYGQYQI